MNPKLVHIERLPVRRAGDPYMSITCRLDRHAIARAIDAAANEFSLLHPDLKRSGPSPSSLPSHQVRFTGSWAPGQPWSLALADAKFPSGRLGVSLAKCDPGGYEVPSEVWDEIAALVVSQVELLSSLPAADDCCHQLVGCN